MILRVGLDALAILLLEKRREYIEDSAYKALAPNLESGWRKHDATRIENALAAGEHISFLIANPEYMWSNYILILDVDTTRDPSIRVCIMNAYIEHRDRR